MSTIRNNKHIFIALIAVVVVIFAASALLLYFTNFETVYAVRSGDDEIFKVKDKETAQKVIEDVMDEYTPDGAQVSEIVLDKKISTRVTSVKKEKMDQEVMNEAEAVDYVIEQNKTDDPLFCVTIKAEVSDVADVESETEYEADDEMFENNTKVVQTGEAGSEASDSAEMSRSAAPRRSCDD